jgi:hypothetical protein
MNTNAKAATASEVDEPASAVLDLLEEVLAETDCPEGDKAEVRRFAALLADAKLPLVDLVDKHGANYLGFTPDEVREIRERSTTGTAAQ